MKSFNTLPPLIVPTQEIFHSACDDWEVEGHLSWQLNGPLESHAYTARNGDRYKIVPYNRRAQANYGANRRPDGTGALSMESGSDINAEEPWTDLQLESMIEWGRERCSDFPTIAKRRCRNPNDPGIGFHTMWGAPSAWTPVAKTCPGGERKKQFEQVLLPGIIKDGPVVIDLKPKDWFDMATVDELREIVRQEVGNRLKDLDSVIRETYNRADWINSRTEGQSELLTNMDMVVRDTFNRADWVNERTRAILDKLVGEAPKD